MRSVLVCFVYDSHKSFIFPNQWITSHLTFGCKISNVATHQCWFREFLTLFMCAIISSTTLACSYIITIFFQCFFSWTIARVWRISVLLRTQADTNSFRWEMCSACYTACRSSSSENMCTRAVRPYESFFYKASRFAAGSGGTMAELIFSLPKV